ncbi:MAG: hypothetical protein LBR85_09115 [Oscillospiraceae bacterium]|nr:hypothetical protein [Oscillospiraceae bacterium]
MKMRVRGRRGDIAVTLLLIMTVLITLSGIIGEYMRISAVTARAEAMLLQAANVAVEASMWDSSRADGGGAMDEAYARQVFDDYLRDAAGLTSGASRVSLSEGGREQYRLENMSLFVESEPPSIRLDCALIVPIGLPGLGDMRVDLRVTSRNARTE